jgi:hypothetical protein
MTTNPAVRTAAPTATKVVMTAITWIAAVIQNRNTQKKNHNKEKNSDEGDFPPDGNDDLIISSSKEDISVDESNDSNNNLPDDLLNVLYGESPPCHGGVQDGQQHQEETGGVEENELYDKSLHDDKVEDESDRDKSGGLEERKD